MSPWGGGKRSKLDMSNTKSKSAEQASPTITSEEPVWEKLCNSTIGSGPRKSIANRELPIPTLPMTGDEKPDCAKLCKSVKVSALAKSSARGSDPTWAKLCEVNDSSAVAESGRDGKKPIRTHPSSNEGKLRRTTLRIGDDKSIMMFGTGNGSSDWRKFCKGNKVPGATLSGRVDDGSGIVVREAVVEEPNLNWLTGQGWGWDCKLSQILWRRRKMRTLSGPKQAFVSQFANDFNQLTIYCKYLLSLFPPLQKIHNHQGLPHPVYMIFLRCILYIIY